MSELEWRTAVACNHSACVEVAPLPSGVALRSSKAPSGPVVVYDENEWRTFIEGVKRGDFDDTL